VTPATNSKRALVTVSERRERRHVTELIDAAVDILDLEHPMTIRQLFYRLVSAGKIPNQHKYYHLVSRVMTKAREDGRVEFDYIVDRSRPAYQPNVWEDAAGYAETVKKAYRKDYWATQPYHVEVWAEKDAIIGAIQPVTDELGVTVRVQRGFISTTKAFEIADHFDSIDKPIMVFYLGDHDPSGQCIEADALARIQGHSCQEFSLKRLAIHKDDIAEYDLPPLRIKSTDTRSANFRNQFGEECVELDALPPDVLRDRIKSAIESLIDRELWDRAVAVEEAELSSIQETVARWNRSLKTPSRVRP
jgi:hypothetical protein